MDRGVIRHIAAPSYLGNAARNQERVGLVIKRWRPGWVLCVAVQHEYDQTLPHAAVLLPKALRSDRRKIARTFK
jgi:hypothetical protein